jgi:hypothetical protein
MQPHLKSFPPDKIGKDDDLISVSRLVTSRGRAAPPCDRSPPHPSSSVQSAASAHTQRKHIKDLTQHSQAQSRQSGKLFHQSSELRLPQPLTRRRVCPPPRFWGEGHTRWRERGWEIPNSDEGTYTVGYFVLPSILDFWSGE